MQQSREPSIAGRWSTVTPASLAAALTRPAMVMILWFAATIAFWNMGVQLGRNSKRLGTRQPLVLDFSIYYLSASVAREGGNPYTADFGPLGERLGLEAGDIRHATDPPTFLLLTEPLARLEERSAFYVWSGVNAIFFILSLVLLLGKSVGLSTSKRLALAALAFLYPAVGIHFFTGQSKMPVLLLLAAMLRLMERGWERAAGLCLAFASLLRVFPILLIGYFVIRRRWRVVAWTVLGIAAGGIATIAAFGTGECLSFLTGMRLLAEPKWLTKWQNISVRASVSRLIWFFVRANGASLEELRRVAVLAADLILLGLTMRATQRINSGEDRDWRGLSLWIVASILLSPTAWVHYMVLCFILFGQLAIASEYSRASKRAQWAAIASYIAMLIPATLPMLSVSWAYDMQAALNWPAWLVAVLSETWFAAAALTYLASYWFTVDRYTPASG